MNKKLREAVKTASDKLNEADCAVQNIHKYLIFSGFSGDEPKTSACNGSHEIILEYYGNEMTIEEAIDRMENIGYITLHDFI